MNDPLRVHANVGVLEAGDSLPAAPAMRKKREGVAGELLQDWVVVPT
jgi:hypothetical protein